LQGVGDKGTEIVYSEEKNILYCVEKSLYRHDKPNEPTKEGPLSFVLFESPSQLSVHRQQWPPLSGISGYRIINQMRMLKSVFEQTLVGIFFPPPAVMVRNLVRRNRRTAIGENKYSIL
jgi:hypothetical protein